MAQQFTAPIYASATGISPNVILGGPQRNATPVYNAFPSAGVMIHQKTNFERFFATNGQGPGFFWNATNAVIEDKETGVVYSSPWSVEFLKAQANA